MAKFPRREADVVVLSDAMIAGYAAHPDVFPSADLAALQKALSAYMDARDSQVQALAQAKTATEAKYVRLDGLRNLMMDQIEVSEADTEEHPENLELIGWGAQVMAKPSDPPGQPRSLEHVIQGPGTVFLDWKAPTMGSGGTVRTFVIQRREQPLDDGAFGNWEEISQSIENEITLTDQSRGKELQYRVLATNAGGPGAASNTVTLVL